LDELEASVVGWVRLASEGRLSRLEEPAGVINGRERYGTNAERFKAFLLKYKAKHKFKTWNYDRMKMLRYKRYKVVHEDVGKEKSQVLQSGKSLV
jgi:hypothetical protein